MPVLYYIHDPMCSWCWGFKPTLQKLKTNLPENIQLKYLLGGLASDTDETMPQSLQNTIQKTWRTIQLEIPGTSFNFEFWKKNTPRRSTYPACRAVIAGRQLNPDLHFEMIDSIQQAYYLNALNPSDTQVLVELASGFNIDSNDFTTLLYSAATQTELDNEINLSRELGAQGFPSLILQDGEQVIFIPIDYNHHNVILSTISHHLSATHQ